MLIIVALLDISVKIHTCIVHDISVIIVALLDISVKIHTSVKIHANYSSTS